ncbi:MAG: branched-chain amino acid ABC transporter permease [Candidatus Goldbacteria bacterium]|nr:branched-chain amino acid ABC transporter permease [Candidatus Goldiibacteriota bacterium]
MRKIKDYLPWIIYFIFFIGLLIINPGPHYIHLAARIIIYGLYAVAFNLIYGTTGLVSFGHALFYGIGAYVTGMLVKASTPELFYLYILIGAFGAAFISFFIGLLTLRLTGIYFTMLTLAFAQLVWGLTFKLYHFTGGDDGIQAIAKPTLLAGGVTKYYLFSFVVVTISIYILWRIKRSPFGSVLSGIRQNPQRITFLGLNVYKNQLKAFIISAFFAGIAGGLYAGLDGSIHPDMLHWPTSGNAILMATIGGMSTFFGPVVGAGILTGLEEIVGKYTEYWSFYIGIVVLIVVLLFPNGVLGIKKFTGSKNIEEKEKEVVCNTGN